MNIEFIYEYGPAGDQCCGYNIRTDQPCTVQQFVNEVLRQRPGEWGIFRICTQEGLVRSSDKEPEVAYKKGGELKAPVPAELAEKPILAIKARGGWTAMDYFIAVDM